MKIPAHKAVLSASSTVFNAMFNGDLKEEGDVKIVDASSTAFKEFFQLFYGHQVELTMDNIAEVLKLVDKYDVAEGFAVCVDFLKDHLVVDDIIWGLHLAIKFKLGELKAFCKRKIEEHSKEVWDMFEMDDGERLKLSHQPNDRYMSDEDIERILHHVYVISKNIMYNETPRIDSPHGRSIFPIHLVDRSRWHNFSEYETIRFSLTAPMLLVDIFCSDVSISDEGSLRFPHDFEMVILRSGCDTPLYSTEIVSMHGDNRVKLTNPIRIEGNHRHAIVMKTSILWKSLYTHKANIPKEPVELAPKVHISFENVERSTEYTHSLISQLYFMRTDD